MMTDRKMATSQPNQDIQVLSSRLESLNSEYQICRRKLESKCEALLILSKELAQCRSERDQYKLMAEQLRDRYQMVKRQLTGDTPVSPSYLELDPKTYSDTQSQSLARLLFDTKESNKSLKLEVEDLKQKLQDAEGDIKLLREQIVRSRVGTTDEGLNTRHFPAHEREDLVKQLETSREEFVQLERDLQQVLDEKEELVTERDTFRDKYERLNTELNYILRGDEKRIVDIDALSMENKFLQEKLKQMEEEKTMAIATVTKYKSILEKKKTKGITKLGQSRSGGLVISQKQVQQILQSRSSMTPTPQALADLQGLCGALLDTINDKNLALSHQRKTNKLLGNRVNELEKKLKTLEVSGLWSVSGTNHSSLEKLKAECDEIKTLVPRKFSQSSEASEQTQEASDVDSDLSSVGNSSLSSPLHQGGNTRLFQQLSRLDLEELDLLPTKEEVVREGAESDDPKTPLLNTGIGSTQRNTDPGLSSGQLSAGSNLASAQSVNSFLDPTIGVSGACDMSEEKNSSLSEKVLPSLIDQQVEFSLSAQSKKCESDILSRVGVQKYIEDSESGDDCPDFLQTLIDRHAKMKSDNFHDSYEAEDDVTEDEKDHGEEDQDEDEEEDEEVIEAQEQFRTLMESVTSKLLERSQQARSVTVSASQKSDQPLKETNTESLREENSTSTEDATKDDAEEFCHTTNQSSTEDVILVSSSSVLNISKEKPDGVDPGTEKDSLLKNTDHGLPDSKDDGHSEVGC